METNTWRIFSGVTSCEARIRWASATVVASGDGLEIQFTAVASRTYTVLFRDDGVGNDAWQKLANVPAQGMTRVVAIPDETPEAERPVRLYRIVTPAVP